MVGSHIVFGEDECTAIDLQITLCCRRSTDCTLLSAIVEVGYGETTAIDDGSTRIIAIFQVECYVSILIDSHITWSGDTTLAHEHILTAIEEYSIGNHRFVDRYCL